MVQDDPIFYEEALGASCKSVGVIRVPPKCHSAHATPSNAIALTMIR